MPMESMKSNRFQKYRSTVENYLITMWGVCSFHLLPTEINLKQTNKSNKKNHTLHTQKRAKKSNQPNSKTQFFTSESKLCYGRLDDGYARASRAESPLGYSIRVEVCFILDLSLVFELTKRIL